MQLNNAICLDRSTDINSTISSQQLDFVFKHRHVEIELLKRALVVARERLLTTKDTLAEVIEKSEAIPKGVTEDQAQLRKEGFDLEDSLQQSLKELQDELAKTQEENQAELEQLQTKHQQRVLELQTALDEANLSAGNKLAQAEADISALRQQILTKESSKLQLQQEKAELGNCLQAETAHNLEFTQQIQSLEEDKQRLETELRAEQLASKDAEHRHNDELSVKKSELDLAQTTIEELRSSRQQLEETLEQTQVDSKKLEEEMNLALEAEKQSAIAEQARFESEIDALNQQLETTRAEADQQVNDAQRQAQVGSQMLQGRMNQSLEAERQNSRQEQRRMNAVIEALNKQLEEARSKAACQLDDERREAQAELLKLQEHMDQAIKTQKQSVKKELKQLRHSLETEKQYAKDEQIRFQDEIKKLSEQLKAIRAEACKQRDRRIEQETQLQKERNTTKQLKKLMRAAKLALIVNRKRTADAQKSFSELQQQFETNDLERRSEAEKKIEHSSSSISKSEQESLFETKLQLEDQLSILEIKFAELTAAADAERQKKDSLSQELEITKAQIKDSDALQRIKDENTALKQKIEGLREVQVEMERQLNMSTDTEAKKLHASLMAIEEKLKKAEKLAQQSQTLMRENKIHVSAIDILDEELDALTKERESLIEMQNKLTMELDENRQYSSELASENNRLQAEVHDCQNKLQQRN